MSPSARKCRSSAHPTNSCLAGFLAVYIVGGMEGKTTHLLTNHEAGALLRMIPARVLRLAKAGDIPHVKLPDGEIRFVEHDFLHWVESRKQVTEASK